MVKRAMSCSRSSSRFVGSCTDRGLLAATNKFLAEFNKSVPGGTATNNCNDQLIRLYRDETDNQNQVHRTETAVAASLVIAISTLLITLVLTLGSGIGL
jgi:hypothetical protein